MKRGKLDSIAGNILDRNFGPDMPNLPWLSDITYVWTYEAFLSVATVIELFSLRIVIWAMDKNIDWNFLNHVNLFFLWFLVAFTWFFIVFYVMFDGSPFCRFIQSTILT
jgi:putative transposase